MARTLLSDALTDPPRTYLGHLPVLITTASTIPEPRSAPQRRVQQQVSGVELWFEQTLIKRAHSFGILARAQVGIADTHLPVKVQR